MRRARVPRAVSRHNSFDQQTLRAYRLAVRRYAHKPWVTGVSISVREREGALAIAEGSVIAIHVLEKLRGRKLPVSRRIPKLIEGIPTDVIEANYDFLDGGPSAVMELAAAALRPGASIARSDGSAATLGGVVRDASGALCLLCAAHTLQENRPFTRGFPIVQPGPADANGQSPTVVARYERVHFGFDAGIARLEPNIEAANLTLVTNVQLGPPGYAQKLDLLEKVGRSTGRTQAVVQGIGTFDGVYPALHLRAPQPNTNQTALSLKGDSGAVWYNPQTNAPVALHSSGSGVTNGGNEYGVAAILPVVLHDMHLTWS